MANLRPIASNASTYALFWFKISGMEQETKQEFKKEKTKGKRFGQTSVQKMCLIAVFLALMCVLAPISIPIQPIAITLATLALYLIGAVFSWKISVPIVLLYLLLGLAGMPIFSNFRGGPQVLFGPTGGYLIGYVPCVLIESLLIGKFKNKLWMYPIAMVIGTVVLYSFGTGWFLIYANPNYDFAKALMLCVVPFLPGDAAKIVVATFAGYRLRKFADRQME